MLETLQLAAIVKTGGQMQLYRIPLHQTLQSTLAESWQDQYKDFVAGIQEIDFDAGYSPEAHERFRLEGYELPDDWNNQSAPDLDAITDDDNLIEVIKGIVGFARDAEGEELVLFQDFSRSHVIRPGRFLLLRGNTYQGTQRPGLTLQARLSALFRPAESKLLFRNFRTTNTFLPLADSYRAASEHDIQQVLNHDLLAPEDAETLAVGANQWFRKRFAMLKDSAVLDKHTAKEIKKLSKDYEVDVQLVGKQIVFPADKAAAKRLLQFLNEEIFRGAITDTLYETNSKREAD